ncbi:MAG: polyprenyl synthetase family protein [Planctomycetota bacterium]
MEATTTQIPFADRVRNRLEECVRDVARRAGMEDVEARLAGGKMLRSRLPGRIQEHAGAADPDVLREVCTAAELVHTASLCHDDVVDGSEKRRGRPSLWTELGRTGAVLVGDLLFAEAVRVVREAADGAFMGDFAEKVKETSAAEAEQELVWRGEKPDEETHVRLARGKTGPLFALTACACAEPGHPAAEALEEAGYRVGTAYQLADDLVDVVGSEQTAGKTLGTDRRRSKYTLAMSGQDGPGRLRDRVEEMCRGALETLNKMPHMRDGVRGFLSEDMAPTLKQHDMELGTRLAELD